MPSRHYLYTCRRGEIRGLKETQTRPKSEICRRARSEFLSFLCINNSYVLFNKATQSNKLKKMQLFNFVIWFKALTAWLGFLWMRFKMPEGRAAAISVQWKIMIFIEIMIQFYLFLLNKCLHTCLPISLFFYVSEILREILNTKIYYCS